MASASVAVGHITVQIEDEDESAKELMKLAHKELLSIVSELEVTSVEEKEEESG